MNYRYACGDNCAKWIVKLAEKKELTINLHHVMDFSEVKDFHAYIINTGKKVFSYEEYIDVVMKIEAR